MKSIYQDEKFAEYWNERSGDEGEPYKRFILDPLMLNLAGSLEGKDVLELGCGNGYLAKKFIKAGVGSLSLLDISNHNLNYAKDKIGSSNVKFVEHDVSKIWPF